MKSVNTMKEFVRKQPHKIARKWAVFIFIYFFIMVNLRDGTEWKMLLLIAITTLLLIYLVGSFLAPFFSGVTLEDGRIEEITPAGGVVKIEIEDIDHEKSFLSSSGLYLETGAGEKLALPRSEYSEQNIRKVARYARVDKNVGLTL